jgi:hypothetical protein
MTRLTPIGTRRALTVLAGMVLVGVAATIGGIGPAAAASAPTATVTHGPYRNGQMINISVGANHFFKPNSRINILECGDPGGKKSNLPTDESTCDGNTIQGNSILVAANGSFSEIGYQVFALPNAATLGEGASSRPICSLKKECVLYIGANQSKFSAPKIFSRSFTIRPAKAKAKA